MAGSSLLIHILILFNFFLISKSTNFTFHGFNDGDLNLVEATLIKPPNGALRLTDSSRDVIGHAFYPHGIPMFNASLNRYNSFSTYFAFQINPSNSNDGGYGLAFTLSPSAEFPGAAAGQYMGVFNGDNYANQSNKVFMVEFDTVGGFEEGVDTEGNHVAINLNGMNPTFNETTELNLQKAKPIWARIDYDGIKKQINVTISRLDASMRVDPLISEDLDLSTVLVEKMYAGFSAATGEDKSSSHYILGWSFRLNGAADELDPSLLPVDLDTKSSPSKVVRKALIAIFSTLLFIFVGIVLYRRVMNYEKLEEWELDHPRRFRYRDIHKATKGFRESEKIGEGGFGAVYRGVLPSTSGEVAVKKIASNNKLQGMREFAAEIESLGRLRHKNLVHLQGWCKHKNDLLLVYDYVPNGSLNSMLYRSNTLVPLTWEQRLNIIKGVASGLLYLHEEWEQVVIHRDVKSSNVLIDRDMSPRLGDFGLARLYDHGKNSHTTNVVGTIGYIAPELTRTGKASTSSDVFAYGILLLEIACGRAAVVCEAHRNVILVDWVAECMEMGSIFCAVDERLNSMYAAEEMELVLGLGLLCSHPRPELRPTMRQVVKYLNGDKILPLIERLSLDGSTRTDELTRRFFALGFVDSSAGSYNLCSAGAMSSTSFDDGR